MLYFLNFIAFFYTWKWITNLVQRITEQILDFIRDDIALNEVEGNHVNSVRSLCAGSERVTWKHISDVVYAINDIFLTDCRESVWLPLLYDYFTLLEHVLSRIVMNQSIFFFIPSMV